MSRLKRPTGVLTGLAKEKSTSKQFFIDDEKRIFIIDLKYIKSLDEGDKASKNRGLDRETNKELLLKHIVTHTQTGSRLQELMQVLPMLSKDQVQKLVKELKLQGTIFNKETTRSALWHPVSIAPK